jgi:hypothetical protein
MVKTPPINPSTLDAYACVADYYLWAKESKALAKALGALGKLAGVFPVAMPRFFLYDGRRQRLAGRHKQAVLAWRRSLALGETLQMPYDQGLVHLELSESDLLSTDERQTHREAARALFERLGAAYEIASAVRQ